MQGYIKWQNKNIGRDINPDELIKRVKIAGAKRIVIRGPIYRSLAFNQIAENNGITINYQGVEEL